MAARERLFYVTKFIVLGWIAVAVVAGIVIGLARILKDTTLTIIVVQVVIYSCFFGVLGWQHYKWKSDRKGWKGGGPNRSKIEDAEDENGWKRQ